MAEYETKELLRGLDTVVPFSMARSPQEATRRVALASQGGAMKMACGSANGYAEFQLASDDILSCSVDAAKLRSVLRGADDVVHMRESGNKLVLEWGAQRVSLATYETPLTPPHLGDAKGQSVMVDGDKMSECIKRCSCVDGRNEAKYAQAIRIVSDMGSLNFIVNIAKAWTCSWIDGVEAEFDAMVVTSSLLGCANSLVDAGPIKLVAYERNTLLEGSQFKLILPSPAMGKPPHLRSKMERFWAEGHIWDVDREQLITFLKQAGIFVTVESTGFWVRPGEQGLSCNFMGVSDGTHAQDLGAEGSCEVLVEGQPCEGKDTYISQRMMLPAVSASSVEGFKIIAPNEDSIFITSEGYICGVSCMSPPRNKE